MFKATGAVLRTPGGNVENISDQKPVIRWAALNVGREVERDPARWSRQLSLYADARIKTLPWLHCRRVEDVDFLVSVGKEWKSPAIGLNIEDVVGDKLDLSQVAQHLESWTDEILMPTLPWVQNGQGWDQLARCVAALEIFPDENEASTKPRDCIDHAFAEGLTKVTLMYKTKPPNLPEHYNLSLCHSLYTADDITPTEQAWAAWEHRGREHPAMPTKTKASKTSKSTKTPKQPSDDPRWHKKPYAKNPRPPEIAFVRALYPPDAVEKEKTPSPPGPDVIAIKRAISRAQRFLPWAPKDWDDTYDDAFAHGEGRGMDRSGVAGFQRQMGLDATGWVGKATFEALRTRVIPAKPGVSHAGEPLFDSVCVGLFKQALEQAAEPPSRAGKPLWATACKMRRAKNDSGPRTAASIKHVVIHSTEGGTASSVAAFFAGTAKASTQLVVDDKECYRCVPDLVIPWGAPGVNSDGLHIEHCGFARWSREEWLSHDQTLRRSAANAAKWCWQYKIPRRWLTVAELQAGTRGFCFHVDATRAFPNNSGHTDPGPNFPSDVYMRYVREYYAEIKAAREP